MWGASANDEESGGAAGWSIADDSRTNNGSSWITDSSESYYIRVNGTARTNTAPTASNGSVTTTANTTGNRVYAFTAGDFNFADADTGDTLEKVKIVTRPGLGTLALSGTAVSVNQEVSKADIDAGNLTFMLATDATGSPYTTFTFKVNDGEAESTTAYTMTVNVTAASVLSIAFAKTPIAEGTDDTASFTVTRTGSTAAELGFNLSASGTATVVSDYTALSGPTATSTAYTISAGQAGRTVIVSIGEQNDFTPEPTETLTIAIDALPTYTVHAANGSATLTILDDDRPNSPATGVPAVTGTARVGETLTAVTADIADAEGLPDSFSYQWVRVASGTDTDISGATSSTYTLAGADEGNTVKVEVSFTDDAGNAEGPLTSAATGSVAPPLLSIADASGSEGDSITFTATLSAVSVETVTATWTASVESGDTAASGDLTGTLTGTLTFAPGEPARTFTVATAEDTVDEVDETFTVTLSNLSNATLTGGTATGTIEDDDGAAVLRIADARAAEGDSITFTATLSPASGKTVTVNYATSVATDDTATTGDFTAKSGSLSFAPGDTEKTITVATTGDAVDEPDETFTVTLTGLANATLTGGTATGTIDDDDDPPGMQIGDVTVDEGDTANFEATLSRESGKTVTVTWTASLETGDTAESADLGSTLSGTLVFDPGETSKPVEVATAEDTTDEPDETFTVTLTGGDNATTTAASAQGTIVDNDAAPALSVAGASATEGDSITFRVTLSPASGKTVTVKYATSLAPGDTATTDDYTPKSGSLSFGPGDTEKTFTVATAGSTGRWPPRAIRSCSAATPMRCCRPATSRGLLKSSSGPARSMSGGGSTRSGRPRSSARWRWRR